MPIHHGISALHLESGHFIPMHTLQSLKHISSHLSHILPFHPCIKSTKSESRICPPIPAVLPSEVRKEPTIMALHILLCLLHLLKQRQGVVQCLWPPSCLVPWFVTFALQRTASDKNLKWRNTCCGGRVWKLHPGDQTQVYQQSGWEPSGQK